MKKLLALSLATILVLSLAACGKDDDSSKAAETTAATTTVVTTTEAPESSEPEPVVVEFPELKPDANSVTFDKDSDFSFAAAMAEKNFENDESNVKVSIAELEGESMLKVEVLDKDDKGENYKIPKLVFDLTKLVAPENYSKISKVTADVFQVAVGPVVWDDGTEELVPGWMGGAFAINNSVDDKALSRWTANNYEFQNDGENKNTWSYSQIEVRALSDAERLPENAEKPAIVLMRWGMKNQADIYVDNLTFYDKDGNTIPLILE